MMIIYYDSQCKLCTNSSLFWKKVDWNHHLTFESFRSTRKFSKAMEESLHIYHQEKWYRGFNALIEISKQLPVTWVLVPFMYFLKWVGLGDFVYKQIAKNRKLIPVNQCTDNGCRIDS